LRPLLRLRSMEAEATAAGAAGLTVVADSTEEVVEAAARTRAAAVSVAAGALALVRAAEARIHTAADDRQFRVTAALTAARADTLRVRAARTVTAVLVPVRPVG